MEDKLVIGIDLGGTKIRGGVVNHKGEVIDWLAEFIAPESNRETVLAQFYRLIDHFLATYRNIAGVGVGTPGVVSSSGTVVGLAANLRGWTGILLKEILEDKYGIGIEVENDVSVRTLGEYYFGDPGLSDSFACIVASTGVGVGIMLNGRLLRSAHELGHMSVRFDGRKCSCGRKGCVEAYCSGEGMKRYCRDLLEEMTNLPQEEIQARASDFIIREENDPILSTVVDDFLYAMSALVANLVLAFSITDFVIAGGVANSFPVFGDRLLDMSRSQTVSGLAESITIRRTPLGDTGGVLGAASLFTRS